MSHWFSAMKSWRPPAFTSHFYTVAGTPFGQLEWPSGRLGPGHKYNFTWTLDAIILLSCHKPSSCFIDLCHNQIENTVLSHRNAFAVKFYIGMCNFYDKWWPFRFLSHWIMKHLFVMLQNMGNCSHLSTIQTQTLVFRSGIFYNFYCLYSRSRLTIPTVSYCYYFFMANVPERELYFISLM